MMLLWLACSSPAPEAPTEPQEAAAPPVVQAASAEGIEPRFSQDELERRPDAVALEGYLICPGSEGPWTLAVYSAHPEFTGPEPGVLPWMPPVTLLEVEDTGAFSIRSPQAEKLLLMAFQGEGEVQAFADPQGSYMPVEGEVGALVLDCRHTPDWGERAPTTALGEQRPSEERAADHDNDWLYETPSSKRNLQQDYDDIEAGYEHYLGMLGDRPDAADLAASLAMMPDQEAAQRLAEEAQ